MTQLILASASPIRSKLLYNAGIDFKIEPAHIDENAVKKQSLAANLPVKETALILAEKKAIRGYELYKDKEGDSQSLILGVDQMLEIEGHWLDKPENVTAAAEQLRQLRGKTHHLISAASIVKNGEVIWQQAETASLTMHHFSEDFLDDYIQKSIAKEERTKGKWSVFSSPGAYHLERQGSQLFEEIKGDYFTILGLPLLPILKFLRDNKVIKA